MYDKTEEETDELILAEDDAVMMDPEDLPLRLLTDFAIYNSEVWTCVCFHLLRCRN